MVAFGILGVEDQITALGSISPNPCMDFLDVRFVQGGRQAVQICDLQGKVLKRMAVLGDELCRIDVSVLSSGVYLLCDGKGGALKFVKQ
ncbi:MAG: T9SS type A sorting domain-containing protein [Bacteroidetes bacterium]|nr:T9SS type A sorting domain-containing protein [Bacteroidota bacterium]